jgi:hypothetical protein
MTTEREQHELAAKAAGLFITWKEGACKGGPFAAAFIGNQPWRPKEDDGDSLRLAVKLGINISYVSDGASIIGAVSGDHEFEEINKADPYAATRLAIFRAAVEIGKAMQASTRPHNVAKG